MTQTQDSEDLGSEMSDFPPCLVGNNPPLISCSPPAVPSRSQYLWVATIWSDSESLTISSEIQLQQHLAIEIFLEK